MTRTALFLTVSYKWEPGPCKKHCSALIGCQNLEGIPWCLPQSDQQWFYLPTWHTASGLNGQVSVLFSLTEISRKRLLEVYCSFISVCVFVVHFCVHLFSSTQRNPRVIGYAINFLWNTVIGEKNFIALFALLWKTKYTLTGSMGIMRASSNMGSLNKCTWITDYQQQWTSL